MTRTIYDVTDAELFRLVCAYMAIRKPSIRLEFLELVESWAREQWPIVDSKGNQSDQTQ